MMRNALPGCFFFIVGPSGAGKDSLIDGARKRLPAENFIYARRVITRPAGSPGEDHEACTTEQFLARQANQEFLIAWQAHGLHYGLSAQLKQELASGRHVIANGSRAMIAQLAQQIPSLIVVEITAPAEVLMSRLVARGREKPDDVAKRLARKTQEFPSQVEVIRVTNDLTLEVGIERFVAALLTRVNLAPPSLRAVYKKIAGGVPTDSEYQELIKAIVNHEHTESALHAFLIACTHDLQLEEIISIAKARSQTVPRISWPSGMVVDKHSMGGIPGSRVTMVVIPIVAAHGLLIPKTSSRAITSAAGTADAMEVLAKVDLTPAELRACVLETNACIAWNGKLNHSILDEVMNALTRPLGLDTRSWSVASILSKKYTAGSTHVVIDIPYTSSGKVKSKEDAESLAQLFERVGQQLGLVVKAFATDGDSPIGRGIGPALEVRDVLQVLDHSPEAPSDLLEKSLFYASQILALDESVGSALAGRKRAYELLASGAARQALDRIIDKQGRQTAYDFSNVKREAIQARAAGTIRRIDGFVISGIARTAGAPTDHLAGVDLLKSAGEQVQAGESLYLVQASDPARLALAVQAAQQDSGYRIN